jgi:site-specific DNA-methyltransferase (adenine-specific)
MDKNVNKNVILHGDCLEKLRDIPDNSIDAVVTDPPYGLSKEPDIYEVLTKWMNGEDYQHRGGGFMGKTWDSFVPGPSVWREVFRVLQPGGHVVCFAGTRMQDLMTVSLRLAGFEIRDVIEWIYFSGFPKSMDVGKAFDKRNGRNYPDDDFREIIYRKEAKREKIGERSYRVTENSTWGQEVNGGRFKIGEHTYDITAPATDLAKKWDGWGTALKPSHEPIILARKPIEKNVAYNVEKYGTGAININGCRIWDENKAGRFPANCITTERDAFFSKYFNITPPELSKKASKKDRNSDWRGEEISLPLREKVFGNDKGDGFGRGLSNSKHPTRNNHPTVKPTDLMAWLVRLITPPGGVVLDPFAGSGSTLVAAKREGFNYIGIERESEYVEIARARVGEEIEKEDE